MNLADRVAILESVVRQLAEASGLEMPSPRKRRPSEPHRDDDDGFDEAWAAYPKRAEGNPRVLAMKAYRKRIAEGVSPEALLSAVKGYSAHCRAVGKEGTAFVMQGATFFGPNGRWQDTYALPEEQDDDLDDLLASVQSRAV